MIFRTIISAIVAGVIAGSVSFLIQHSTLIPLIYQAELPEQTPQDEHSSGEPLQDATTRTTYTLIGDILLACGFGLILCTAYIVTGQSGVLHGICWGLAGFATFHLGPAIVVPPLMPGLELGSLATRQAIWLVAAFSTAVGLALLILGGKLLKAIGVLLLAMPVVIEELFPTPQMRLGSAAAPERSFIFWSLVGSWLMWLLLGSVSGGLFARLYAGDRD